MGILDSNCFWDVRMMDSNCVWDVTCLKDSKGFQDIHRQRDGKLPSGSMRIWDSKPIWNVIQLQQMILRYL